MQDRHSRTALLLGKDAIDKLKGAHVAVFGLGGVGSYLVEALVRAGVGELTLIDSDIYTQSNLNRQLYATSETLGQKKTDAARDRIRLIDPTVTVHTCEAFVLPENIGTLPLRGVSYLADAIDTVSAKIALAVYAKEHAIPMISAMGAGNKLDPTAFRVTTIDKTKVCPLSRIIRTKLKQYGISNLKVVYSEEDPIKSDERDENSGKPIPGSCSFVPSVVGLIMAGEIIKDLTK